MAQNIPGTTNYQITEEEKKLLDAAKVLCQNLGYRDNTIVRGNWIKEEQALQSIKEVIDAGNVVVGTVRVYETK
jgi:hypothetical protein